MAVHKSLKIKIIYQKVLSQNKIKSYKKRRKLITKQLLSRKKPNRSRLVLLHKLKYNSRIVKRFGLELYS